MLYPVQVSIIHLPELPQRWSVYILLKQSKFIPKKNKSLSSEGRFLQSHLPFQAGKCRRCARRQVESRFCLHQQAHVKVKSDFSLNPLWTSLTARVIWNPPPSSPHPNPELPSCFTKRPASDWDPVPLLYATEGWWICWLDYRLIIGFPLWIMPFQYQSVATDVH